MPKKSFFARFLKSKQVPEKPQLKQHPTQQQTQPTQVPIQQTQPEKTQQSKQEPQEQPKESEENYEGQLAIDVYQTPNEIIIKSTIAGVKPENIDINIDNDMITIKGERKEKTEIQETDYYYQECYWGSFSRSIILPEEVNADDIQAELKNGILTIQLPKAHQVKSKKIEVKMAEDKQV